MYVTTVNTRKGLVIRYVFEDVEEYQCELEWLEDIAKNRIAVDYREDIEDVIQLFKEYYDESNIYCDGKPAVTIFENHIYKIGALIFVITNLDLVWLKKHLADLREQNKILNLYIRGNETEGKGDTTAADDGSQ